MFEGYVVLFNGFVMLHDDGEQRLNCVSLKNISFKKHMNLQGHFCN